MAIKYEAVRVQFEEAIDESTESDGNELDRDELVNLKHAFARRIDQLMKDEEIRRNERE